jgi:hypothetical protein
LRGTLNEHNTVSEENVSRSAQALGGCGLSATEVSQPKANLSYQDKRSVFALPIVANNYGTSETTGENKLLKSQASQPGQLRNFPILASPEEFMARNWGTVLKAARDGGKEAKPLTLQPNQYLSSNLAAETNGAESSDTIGILSPGVAVRRSLQINREILEQAVAKVEVMSQDQENISLDQANAQIVRITCPEQDLLVIVAKADGKPDLQCHVDSIINLVEGSYSLKFESVDAEIRKKWCLTFRLPWIAVQFREKLSQYFPELKYTRDVGTLISFSDEPEVPTEVCSKFTEDLLSLMDDTAVDQILDAINRDASKPLLDQVTEIIESVQSETPITSISESSQQLIGLDILGEQNTASGDSSGSSLSLLQRYGGLASSIFATATEEVVRDFQSKSTVFNSLPEGVSRDYTRKLSGKLLHRAQGPANAESESPSSSPSKTWTGSGMGTVNDTPKKLASTRITYTIEELKKHRSQACVVKKNLLQEWIPTWVPPSHRPKPAAKVEAKKPQGLADSIYADKQTVNITPVNRYSNPWEAASLSLISTANFKHGTTVTFTDKSRHPLGGVPSSQDAVHVKQATPASTKSYYPKNGLSSSRYATMPTLSSSSSKPLDTKNSIREVLSAASILNGSPARELVESKVPLNSENFSAIKEPTTSSRAKPKSSLSPICRDFFPPNKDYPGQRAITSSSSNSVQAYAGLRIATNSSSVIDTSVHLSPRYETVLLPDPIQPGYYQEVRGILKINNPLQPPQADTYLGTRQPVAPTSPVPVVSNQLTALAGLPTPPKPVSRM